MRDKCSIDYWSVVYFSTACHVRRIVSEGKKKEKKCWRENRHKGIFFVGSFSRLRNRFWRKKKYTKKTNKQATRDRGMELRWDDRDRRSEKGTEWLGMAPIWKQELPFYRTLHCMSTTIKLFYRTCGEGRVPATTCHACVCVCECICALSLFEFETSIKLQKSIERNIENYAGSNTSTRRSTTKIEFMRTIDRSSRLDIVECWDSHKPLGPSIVMTCTLPITSIRYQLSSR